MSQNQTILSQATIDRLVAAPERDVAALEALFPARDLPEHTAVTRVAPSPTGFMHLGTIYASLVSERAAHANGNSGVFYLRIEDTDKKREVEGARQFIIDSLNEYALTPNEGPATGGAYGPYAQSERAPFYHAYIRQLLSEGKAYPCFMTPEELQQTIQAQNAAKTRPGYYGQWATWRDRPETDVLAALESGKPYVIRFRSTGDITKRRDIHDVARGHMSLPENDNDVVIMKQDGLPTYHFAHAVDDYLMHTTLVTRGDEWLPSTTLHMQLCEALGHQPFTYAHIAPIQKMDSSARRKLSKRKDPEASMSYYAEQGYLPATVIEYLLNLANSSFEEWRVDTPQAHYNEFPFDIAALGKSGALFSIQKLDSIGAEHIAQLSTEQVVARTQDWSKQYEPAFYAALTRDPAYTLSVFGVERSGENPRKDMKHFSQAPNLYGYFYDDIYESLPIDPVVSEKLQCISPADRQAIVHDFMAVYNPEDSNEEWFEKLKTIAEPLGFTPNMKDYRKNPDSYKGSVADAAMVLRVGLTKRNQTPSLQQVMRVMGPERTTQRLRQFVGE